MASTPIPPIQQESLAELAYQALWASIVEGRLAMGHRLVETTLARELGISRGPVREALRRLYEDGLVDQQPRRGSFVRRFEANDLVDIYNVRLAIETAAARLVIRRQQSLAPLAEIIELMRAAVRADDFGAVVAGEFAFHERLFELSQNEYLLQTFRSLAAQIRMALSLDNRTFQNLSDIVEEHVSLLEALHSGDDATAAHAIQEHIVSTVGATLAEHGIGREALLEPLVASGA